MSKRTVALIFSQETQASVISPATREAMMQTFHLVGPDKPGKVTPELAAELLKNADGCITGWGSPCVTPELLKTAPKLSIICHSAGTVKPYVCDAVFERNIAVTTAAPRIGQDVADYTLGIILTSMKNMMELCPAAAAGKWGFSEGMLKRPDDARGCTVGVISASWVGKFLMKLLPHFEIQTLLYDPFVTAAQAGEFNAEKVELDALFERSDVVTCHAPSVPATQHIVNAPRLAKMKQGATLINTSRGTCVDEIALVEELKKKRIWAFLDVYDPEPPPPGSPLYGCPNLTMTPHIAGSSGRGRLSLGAQAFKELCAFFDGKPTQYGVTQKMLATMA